MTPQQHKQTSYKHNPFAAGGTPFFAKVTKSLRLEFPKRPFGKINRRFILTKRRFIDAETAFYRNNTKPYENE